MPSSQSREEADATLEPQVLDANVLICAGLRRRVRHILKAQVRNPGHVNKRSGKW